MTQSLFWARLNNMFVDIVQRTPLRFLARKSNEETEKRNLDKLGQTVADLIGTSVAGFVPEPSQDVSIEELLSGKARLPRLDLDEELLRRNKAIAELAIISGLVKGDKARQDLILRRVRLEHFRERSFPRYLLEVLIGHLAERGQVSISEIQAKIPGYDPSVWNEPSDEKSLRGHYFQWAQILDFAPTASQIERAIELLTTQASKRA